MWRRPGLLEIALLASTLASASAAAPPALGDDSVVYMIMVDRFADGDDNAPDVDVTHRLPRRFQGGDLAGLRQHLPQLATLGVSHIWLTPLHQQVKGLVGDGDDATAAYHGYWPEEFSAVDEHFGDVDDVRALVADAEALGVGVILDVVVNHTGYGAADPRGLVRHPCGEGDEQRCLFGLPDLRTEDPRVRQAVVDDVAWWLRLAPFAGLRLDAFKHIDRETAVAITSMAHRERPGVVVVAERWGAGVGDSEVRADVAAGAADAAFDFGFMSVAQGFVAGRLRPAAAAHHLEGRAASAVDAPPALHFLDNHDTQSWVHAVGARRAPLGAPLLLLSPGIPVITWGTERGRVGGAKDPDNRSFMPPLADVAVEADDALDDARAAEAFWRSVIAVRRRHPAAQRGTFRVLAASPTPAAHAGSVVFERRLPGERVLAAVALGAPLRHCEAAVGVVVVATAYPQRNDATIVSEGGATRCVDVVADGAVVVVIRDDDNLRK